MKPVQPPASPEAENWGELGPAMKALNERQRAFVRFLVTEKPGYGAHSRAYRKAGYGKNSRADAIERGAVFQAIPVTR